MKRAGEVMAGHTPEPWVYEQCADFSNTDSAIMSETGVIIIAQVWGVDVEAINCPTAKANAERIVACVNACKGINPDAVPLLLAACIESLARFEQDGWPLNEANLSAMKMLREAIKKATGGHPPMPRHEQLTREQHKALIDAANLICEHVQRRLKPGWMIRLEMDSEEATLELFDEEGYEVRDIDSESGVSQIERLCEESWRSEVEEGEAEDDSPRGMGWVGCDGLP